MREGTAVAAAESSSVTGGKSTRTRDEAAERRDVRLLEGNEGVAGFGFCLPFPRASLENHHGKH